jgi:hypothetical protein
MAKSGSEGGAKRAGGGRARGDVHHAARTLGSRGGKVGGPARDAALSSQEKSRIAAEGGRAAAGKGKSKK